MRTFFSYGRGTSVPRRGRLALLVALIALMLAPQLSSEVSARRAALRNRAAKKSATQMHISPMQRKVRMQRKQARARRVWRTPRSSRSNRFASRRKSLVVARRGPMRKRPKARSRFNQRKERKSRTIDKFGRWTRPDHYSIR